jgi:hypothetical protein
MEGKFNVEAYRVQVEVGGLFGNPNDMALHYVMMTPLVICLGLAQRARSGSSSTFASAGLFLAANMVTFSRGGFIGLVACAGRPRLQARPQISPQRHDRVDPRRRHRDGRGTGELRPQDALDLRSRP